MKKRRKRVVHQLKRRNPRNQRRSILGRISWNSSSLSQAYRLTQRASRVGFDWPNVEGVLNKLHEEMTELKEAISLQDREKIGEEIGDLLFVMANVSRFLRIHPEKALKKSLQKFVSRFHYIETSLRRQGKSPIQSDLTEMDRLWEESKKKK